MNTVYGPIGDWRALGVVAALALLSVEPVAQAVGLSQPLMVSLLSAAEPEPPKELPKPLPPKPQQVQPVRSPGDPIGVDRQGGPAELPANCDGWLGQLTRHASRDGAAGPVFFVCRQGDTENG
jgi:hypothetical protein